MGHRGGDQAQNLPWVAAGVAGGSNSRCSPVFAGGWAVESFIGRPGVSVIGMVLGSPPTRMRAMQGLVSEEPTVSEKQAPGAPQGVSSSAQRGGDPKSWSSQP